MIASFGLILLFQYQNCAPPAGTAQSYAGDSMAGDEQFGAEVDVIDQINEGDLTFMQKSVAVRAEVESLELDGRCDLAQSGATLRWELRDANNQELGEGYVQCEDGGFRIAVAPVQELECGASYSLIAQLGVEESEAVQIERACVQ